MSALAHLVVHRRRAVLIAATIAIVAGLALAPIFQSQLRGVGYDTPRTASYAATQFIAKHTGYTERDTLVFSSARYKPGDPAFVAAIARGVAVVKHVDRGILVLGPGVRGGGA